MASSFLGLYVQRDALQAAQKSLDIVGNNITNVKTPGYSRQRVDVASLQNNKSNLAYNTAIALAGQGIETVGVAQIRDALLDNKVRKYTSDFTEVGVKVSVMSNVEDAIDNIESDTAGFNSILSKFKATLQAFSTDNADRQELASIAQSAAKSVVEYLNMFDTRFNDISEQTFGDTKADVKRVNAILAELGNLNKQVTDSYINMDYFEITNDSYQVQNQYGPLELKDEINLLIDELSQYGNVEFKEEPDGSFTVDFAGVEVVRGWEYAQIAIRNTDPPPPADPADPLDYSSAPEPMNMTIVVSDEKMSTDEWKSVANSPEERQKYVNENANTDISAVNSLTGGTLRGYLDVYNGNGNFTDGNNAYQGIEYYRSMFNSLAKGFADNFNAIFEEFGFELFTYEDADDFNEIAENLRLSDEWINSPTLISKPFDYPGYTGPVDGDFSELDNYYIQRMLGCFANEHSFDDSFGGGGGYTFPDLYTFETFSAHINDTLGSQVEYEIGVMKTSDIMLQSVHNERDEVMGVSLDEEAISMVNYQKWYNAIARMTTTLDEALDKLINATGRVGL